MAAQPIAIGLGANLGQPDDTLRRALAVLAQLPDIEVIKASPLYRTAPLGPPGQPDYCNAAVALATDLPADDLLLRMQGVERAFGRERNGTRWGPRVLDIDLLIYGDAVIDQNGLSVPHPEMHKRNFVTRPLADVLPDAVVPGHGRVAELADQLGEGGLQLWDAA